MSSREVDPDYALEWDAARAAELSTALINFEDLLAGEVDSALRRVPAAENGEAALYRGWMMPVDRYALLYQGLKNGNIDLITTPEAYRHCHYMPENYADIQALTPRTVWRHSSEGVDIDSIMQTLAPLGSSPAIIKDYVKSRKHEWADACFIPNAADQAQVERVTTNFLRGQGSDLAEGLVFREFVPLTQVGTDKRTGAPFNVEYRLFYLHAKRILVAPHFDEAQGNGSELPELGPFDGIAESIPSPFFSMDIARTADGRWIIIELGDGQVAGLPDSVDVGAFYSSVADRLQR